MQAIVAGGAKAVRGAVEGAEDSGKNGARDLAKSGVKRGDVVVGLAASGTTPYVIGAMQIAQETRRGNSRRHIQSDVSARAHRECRNRAGHGP